MRIKEALRRLAADSVGEYAHFEAISGEASLCSLRSSVGTPNENVAHLGEAGIVRFWRLWYRTLCAFF